RCQVCQVLVVLAALADLLEPDGLQDRVAGATDPACLAGVDEGSVALPAVLVLVAERRVHPLGDLVVVLPGGFVVEDLPGHRAGFTLRLVDRVTWPAAVPRVAVPRITAALGHARGVEP